MPGSRGQAAGRSGERRPGRSGERRPGRSGERRPGRSGERRPGRREQRRPAACPRDPGILSPSLAMSKLISESQLSESQ